MQTSCYSHQQSNIRTLKAWLAGAGPLCHPSDASESSKSAFGGTAVATAGGEEDEPLEGLLAQDPFSHLIHAIQPSSTTPPTHLSP
ncbi:hypothetical protein PtA15_16A307 [Puccinia triticina]|uniref:Uncharacterized protein n=1 Tax=Puccinia triticina TaxID=208348 RepID=A0ABY7D436_9BASI|nr:uncharacterized protein PtA15_16A307 [Puccinia triticina]WAQ92399.1 hypothetical protein PtA15_16A307 [Puccinia triticina]WAR64137.1 hypothetical protein PtB15_16B297 [Puccinia triticina]